MGTKLNFEAPPTVAFESPSLGGSRYAPIVQLANGEVIGYTRGLQEAMRLPLEPGDMLFFRSRPMAASLYDGVLPAKPIGAKTAPPPLHPDTAWGVRWLEGKGKTKYVSDLDLAGGIRNGKWMDAETMDGILKSINTAYGSEVIQHLDLIDGIRKNNPDAIAAAQKNTLVYAMTKDGFKQYGSFAGIMEKYGPGATTIERASGGLRRPSKLVLDDAQIQTLTREFAEVGGDPKILRFNYGNRTGYVDQLDKINIRGDILPLEDAIHPRSTMSSRAVLSHELGHRKYRGTKLEVGAWNDEFRASYWAAKNAPGLSQMERVDLLNDAIMRAREAGVSIKLNRS